MRCLLVLNTKHIGLVQPWQPWVPSPESNFTIIFRVTCSLRPKVSSVRLIDNF